MERRQTLQRRTELRPGKPLQRRTPMPRTGVLTSHNPAPAASGWQRHTALPARSVKRIAEDRLRAVVVARLRAAQVESHGTTFCERCGRPGPVDAHELLSRARGGSVTDPANLALICRGCHDLVTFHHHEIPDAARWVHTRHGSHDHQTPPTHAPGANTPGNPAPYPAVR